MARCLRKAGKAMRTCAVACRTPANPPRWTRPTASRNLERPWSWASPTRHAAPRFLLISGAAPLRSLPGSRSARWNGFPKGAALDTLASPTRFGSGQAVRRLEDDALLAGRGQFTDAFQPQDRLAQLRAVFVRSPYPHARIAAVDAQAARAMAGVVAGVTGADLVGGGGQPLPGRAGF